MKHERDLTLLKAKNVRITCKARSQILSRSFKFEKCQGLRFCLTCFTKIKITLFLRSRAYLMDFVFFLGCLENYVLQIRLSDQYCNDILYPPSAEGWVKHFKPKNWGAQHTPSPGSR